MPGSTWYAAAFLLCMLPLPASGLELELEVVDGKGAPISDLTIDDFRIDVGRESSKIGSLRFVTGLSETRLYIGAEMPATDLALIQQNVEKLIAELPAGVEVSLGGAPFAADKAKLRETLSFGLDLARKSPDAGFLKLWDFGQGYRVQGRPVLDNYTLLASQLAAVPGQKRVILFRKSLELRQDGLDTREMNIRSGQLRQNDADMLRNEDAIDKLGTVAAVSRVRFFTSNSSVESGGMDDHGLNSVARQTGGIALLGAGNPYDVIEAALDAPAGYYVATLDPSFEGKNARLYLKAAVDRPGAEVKLVRGYLLDLPGLESLSGGRSNLLETDVSAAKLHIRAEHWVFKGADGKPIVVVSAGAPVSDLATVDAPNGLVVELTLSAGFQSDKKWEASARRKSRQVFEKKAFAAAKKRGGVTIDVAASGPLPGPGMHTWKTVIQDGSNGALGLVETTIGAHDMARPMATSDILITRRAGPADAASQPEPWGDLLDFGGTRLIPEPTREFRTGDSLLFTYRLYNAPQSMLDNPPPVQLAIFKDEQQLETFDGQGESRVVDGTSDLQYIGSIQTKGLEPGDYLILSAVPGREDERHPYVEGAFRLVK